MVKREGGDDNKIENAVSVKRVHQMPIEEKDDKSKKDYPNNNSTEGDYRWRLHGQDNVRAKKSRSKGESAFTKKYYICSEKKKAGGGCNAKKTVHNLPDGVKIEFKGTHNHPPVANPKTDPEVKKKVMEQLSVGAKPSVIHAVLVNNAEGPITSKNVPKKQQIHNWQHQMVMTKLPTGDALMNLKLTHSPHFLRLLQLDPSISIVLAGANGLNALTESKYVIVDGTFDLVEEKLVLTTLMAYHDGIAIPCAYFLAELKTHKSYLLFFQKVKELTNGRMDPTGCLLDFEEAMASAWLQVFPKCSILRDFFHLQQANTKKMAKIGLADLRKEIVQDIRKMWYADTKIKFDVFLAEFLNKWDGIAPEYSEYFRRVWISQHPPNTWASYARPKDAPSGSGSIEGHHNRLQNNVMPGFSTAIDQFANKLWDEETYYLQLMTTPHLWTEKKTTHAAAVERHLKNKRILLKDIIGSRTVTHHSSSSSSSVSTTTTTTSTSSSVSDLDEDMSGVVSPFDNVSPVSTPLQANPPLSSSSLHSSIHPFFQSSSHKSSTATTSSSATVPIRLDIPAHSRCKCGQYKFNQSCSSKLCQKCCGNSMDHCSVTSHIKCKPVGYQATKYKSTLILTTPLPEVQPGVIEHVARAMRDGREVFIAYANRDPNEKQGRKVKPLQWIRYGEAFKALCFIDDIEKTFNTHKILRIEDQVWEMVKPTSNTVTVSSVEDWLNKMGLTRYWPAFRDNGYDIMDALVGLDEATLDVLDVTMAGHRALLLRKVKEIVLY